MVYLVFLILVGGMVYCGFELFVKDKDKFIQNVKRIALYTFFVVLLLVLIWLLPQAARAEEFLVKEVISVEKVEDNVYEIVFDYCGNELSWYEEAYQFGKTYKVKITDDLQVIDSKVVDYNESTVVTIFIVVTMLAILKTLAS